MSKDVTKWLGVFFAVVLLCTSTGMSIQNVFYSDEILSFLSISAFISSLLTVLFALASFPKWQSYFGIAVFIYSLIWQTVSKIGIH